MDCSCQIIIVFNVATSEDPNITLHLGIHVGQNWSSQDLGYGI